MERHHYGEKSIFMLASTSGPDIEKFFFVHFSLYFGKSVLIVTLGSKK